MTGVARSRMLEEVLQAPAAVERLLRGQGAELESLARRLRRRPPPFAATVARGSSHHAATYGKYLIETLCGVVVSSAAPSVTTVYRSRLRWRDALVLAVSQSGESPDLVETLEEARHRGALTVAVVNRTGSPLAGAAEIVLPMHAGPETSVAATKSFIAGVASLAHLVAAWSQDGELGASLERLPEALEAAAGLDWSAALPALEVADRMLVVGRGYSLPVAREAALKLKETCGLYAEAFSGAEVRHGPMALVEEGLPILALVPDDRTRRGMLRLVADLEARGAGVLVATPEGHAPGTSRGGGGAMEPSEPPARAREPAPAKLPGAVRLPLAGVSSGPLDPLCAVQTFYRFAERLARARGRDPDAPPHLDKVTRTR